MADGGFSRWSDALGPGVANALRGRNFEAYYCKTASEARDLALSLLPRGSSVTWGGSVTLNQIGLIDAVKEGGFRVVDRDAADTPERKAELSRQAFMCDSYLSSVNALSEDGQLVNIDGIGNRVAAITFGPKSVVIVAGMNKVCKTVGDAMARARGYAAPMNVQRLSQIMPVKTPCASTGSCADCRSEGCVCCYVETIRMSRVPGRIKVILVGEPLGY
ncbi:MAG: lactate utilization protein [Candidatus Methanoplasma sp.]|jgi:L-lactate utilization protein LutB|nr:lactate utilization protein [Candidatus Methanoplasma sp.]